MTVRLLRREKRPATVFRQVFPSWSIRIPAAFRETFVTEGDYWHAYDASRSVSLSSVVLEDDSGPVPAAAIAQRFPPLDGTPVDALPPDVLGCAAVGEAAPPARASRALSGMLAADGRVLIVTITGEDQEWALSTWLSIRFHE